jgi:hypothetical protein
MTQEELLALADKAGFDTSIARPSLRESLVLYGELVAEAEREACAKLCEDAPEPDGCDLAERIRNKGEAR